MELPLPPLATFRPTVVAAVYANDPLTQQPTDRVRGYDVDFPCGCYGYVQARTGDYRRAGAPCPRHRALLGLPPLPVTQAPTLCASHQWGPWVTVGRCYVARHCAACPVSETRDSSD